MSINKSIFYTLIAQIPTIILGVVSGIFITRILGPNGKGIYAVFQANIEFLSFLLGFNIASGLVYFIASKKIEPEKLVGMSVYFFVFTCVLVCLFFEIMGHTDYKHYIMPKNYDSGFYIYYLVLAFSNGIISSIFMGIMQGYKFFKTINLITLINSLVNVICYPALYLLMKLNVLAVDIHEILQVALGIAFLNTIITFIFYRAKITVKPNYDISMESDVRPFFKYISVVYIGTVINFLNYRLDIWVLMHYSKDMRPIGFYALAVSVAQLLWMISNPFMRVLLPYLSESDSMVRMKKITMYSRANVAILLAAIFFLCTVGHYLLPIIYGKDFIDSVFPFEILLIGLFFSSAAKPFGTFFTAEDKFMVNVYSNALGVLVTVILCFWLIPPYGIIGACIATDVSYAAMFLYTYTVFLVQSGYSAKNWFLLRKADMEELGLNNLLGFLKK